MLKKLSDMKTVRDLSERWPCIFPVPIEVTVSETVTSQETIP